MQETGGNHPDRTKQDRGQSGMIRMGLGFLFQIEMALMSAAIWLAIYYWIITRPFWVLLPYHLGLWIVWLSIPVALIAGMVAALIGAIFSSRILFWFIKKPELGVYPAFYRVHGGQYKNWARRNAARRFALWLTYLMPFWEIQGLTLKLLGQNYIGKGVVISEKCHIDAELVDIGDRSFIGLGTTILSHSIDGDTIEIARVNIGKDVLVGAHTLINCGVEIGDGAIIAGGSVLRKHQKIPAGSCFGGNPCSEIRTQSPQ